MAATTEHHLRVLDREEINATVAALTIMFRDVDQDYLGRVLWLENVDRAGRTIVEDSRPITYRYRSPALPLTKIEALSAITNYLYATLTKVDTTNGSTLALLLTLGVEVWENMR